MMFCEKINIDYIFIYTAQGFQNSLILGGKERSV